MGVEFKAAILAVCLLPGAEAAADWTVARNGHFEIYSQEGESAARSALQWFEQLRATVQQETGMDVAGRRPVRVIGFASDAEYSRYRPGPAADAYYVGGGEHDCIVMPSLQEDSFPTAAHEYAHVIQHAMRRQLPAWLSEGLADLFSTLRIDRHGTRIGGELPGRLGVLRRNPWIPLERLTAMGEPVHVARATTEVFYAESWALTEMLALSPAYRPHFGELLMAVAAGSAAALSTVYGKPLEAIQQDLAAWAGGHRAKPIPLATAEADQGVVEVSRTPAVRVRLLMAQLLLTTGDIDGAESAYREIASESLDCPEVWAGLGEVAAARKEYDDARALWKRAIEQGLSDPFICYRYAELLDRDGTHLEERRAALERAIALQPDFDDARWVLAMIDNNAGRYDAALSQLEAMHEIPPTRAYHYWCAMANALTGLGRGEDARLASRQASEHARTNDERVYAAQLAYMAETHLAVRMTRDADGKVRMVTTRVANDATEFNPFVEPNDDLRRATGALREIECSAAAMRIVVETASGSLRLTIPDPKRVQMRNAPAEFVCGEQAGNAIVVEYAARKDGEGVVRGMEFR